MPDTMTAQWSLLESPLLRELIQWPWFIDAL